MRAHRQVLVVEVRQEGSRPVLIVGLRQKGRQTAYCSEGVTGSSNRGETGSSGCEIGSSGGG